MCVCVRERERVLGKLMYSYKLMHRTIYIPCCWRLTVYYVTRSEHTIPNTTFRSVTHGLEMDSGVAGSRHATASNLHPTFAPAGDVVVEYRTRNREVAGSTYTRSTASNLEQVADVLCTQANSASYAQQDGK